MIQSQRNRTARRLPRRLRKRLGAAVVEFAVVAPVMILITMGMMEVGRMVMVKQLMINVSREGARAAVLPGATTEEVTAMIREQLTDVSIPDSAQITLSPSILSSAAAGSPVTVSISISADDVSWVPNPKFSADRSIIAATTMRKESQ